MTLSDVERDRLRRAVGDSGIKTIMEKGEYSTVNLRVVVAYDYDHGKQFGRHGVTMDSDTSRPDVLLDNDDSGVRVLSRAYLYTEADWNRHSLDRVVAQGFDPHATHFTLSREDVEELIRDAHDGAPAVAERLRKVLDPRTERTYSVTIRSLDPADTLSRMQEAVKGEAEIAVSDEGESEDLYF